MSDEPVTQNLFLGGKIAVMQPAQGFRAGVDSVLLGASVELSSGARAIEFGCGPGAALMVAAWRNKTASFLGLDSHEACRVMVEGGAQANGWGARIDFLRADIADAQVRALPKVDGVFANPPFEDDPGAVRPRKAAELAAHLNAPHAPLAVWLAAMTGALKDGGGLWMIHKPARLTTILAGLTPACGAIVVLPIHAKAGEPAKRILVSARKGRKTPLALLPPLVLHEPGGAFTPEAEAVLNGAPLPMTA